MSKSQGKLWWTKFLASTMLRAATSPIGLRALGLFVLFVVVAFAVVRRTGHSWLWLIPLIPVAFLASMVLAIRWALQTADSNNSGPHVYDKAKYHYDGDYPKDLPRQQALVHTGMLIGWLIEHDMIAEDFRADTEGFRERKITGAKVYQRWDGCLTSEILTDEANRFLAEYFDDERGQFLIDYHEVLASNLPSTYHVEDTWENFDAISKKIDERYAVWKRRPKAKGDR